MNKGDNNTQLAEAGADTTTQCLWVESSLKWVAWEDICWGHCGSPHTSPLHDQSTCTRSAVCQRLTARSHPRNCPASMSHLSSGEACSPHSSKGLGRWSEGQYKDFKETPCPPLPSGSVTTASQLNSFLCPIPISCQWLIPKYCPIT